MLVWSKLLQTLTGLLTKLTGLSLICAGFLTRADLHFRSDKEIKFVLWPYYYHVSFVRLFKTGVYVPKSSSSMSPSSVVSCDNYSLPTSLIAALTWLKIHKLLISFPLMEKQTDGGECGERSDWQPNGSLVSLLLSVTQQCSTVERHNYSCSCWILNTSPELATKTFLFLFGFFFCLFF